MQPNAPPVGATFRTVSLSTRPLATVSKVSLPTAAPEPSDHSFLQDVAPIVQFLGGTLVADAGPGDLPIERDDRVIAYVRNSELHGALDRMVQTIEREAGASFDEMDRAQKQRAVRSLDEQGAFLLRGAVDQVAKSMGVSRVTLYSYLNAMERRA